MHTIQPENFYPWQKRLLDMVRQPPHWTDRRIIWIWNPQGNSGKSAFTKYLLVHLPGTVVVSGKATDIAHGIATYHEEKAGTDTPYPALVVVDSPRVAEGHVSVAGIEGVKNGVVVSNKYEGARLLFNAPHVIVFANCEPDYDQLSLDRWFVRRIDNTTKDFINGAEMD